jgi:adenosylcobinamide amidohydrolase
MTWDLLLDRPEYAIRRRGRFLVAELRAAAHVLSTSVVNAGRSDCIGFLLNHQSCEGAGHRALGDLLQAIGDEEYHRRICVEAGVTPDRTVMMGTAANMNYAAMATAGDAAVEVTAVVTAGVETNAVCAGDTARWRETDKGIEPVADYAGTINTMLLINAPLTESALARTVMMMTEGKSAALQRLAVPSRQSGELATGTGTDQYCVASLGEGRPPLTSASSHTKLGELIGRSVRDATQEALRWQNGLEPSYTRGIFHALGRYGVREATFLDDIAPWLSAADLELLRRNLKAVAFEPLVGAAAHALAAVLDRVRHGTFPVSVQRDAAIQMAATLAVNAAASPERWTEFRARLHETAKRDDPKELVLIALALGWSEKWRSR